MMDKSEIVTNYKLAKEKGKQLQILADLNQCSKLAIVKILIEGGFDPRAFSKILSKKEREVMEKEEKAKAEENKDKLKADNIRLLNENEKLWQENQEAKKAIDILKSDKDEVTKTVEELKLSIERLNTEKASLETRLEMLTKNHEFANKRIHELEVDKDELENTVEHLNSLETSCSECSNDAVNDLTNAKQEIDRLNDDLDTATKMYLEERRKRKKLKKALLKAVME